MSSGNRKIIIAGNWKMYKTTQEAVIYIQQLAPLVKSSPDYAYLAVPFTSIKACADASKETNITIGAQNMNDATEGAFTGEIAARMLKEAGAKFVILGHSERRHIFNENDEFINRKVKRALSDGLQPILCIGETLQEREDNRTHEVLETQLINCLSGVTKRQASKILLAYEPVWAIGTGKTATPEQAQEMHRFCRELLAKKWDEEIANKISILYGGSVKPDNAKALIEQPDIDGVLVGGASLSVESFSQIINYQTTGVSTP